MSYTTKKGYKQIVINLLFILCLIITIFGAFAMVGCATEEVLAMPGDTTERTYKNDTLGVKFAAPIENSWYFLSEDKIEHWVDEALDEMEDDEASKDIAKSLTKIEFVAVDSRTGDSVVFGYENLVGKDKNITLEEYREGLKAELLKKEERQYSFSGYTNVVICGEVYNRFTSSSKIDAWGGFTTVEQYCYLRKVNDCIVVIVASTAFDTSAEDFEKMFSWEMEFKGFGARYSLLSIGGCRDENIIIPAEHKGLPVTEIEADAFKDARFLETVFIPESIVSIGDSAFKNCSSLTEVVIPSSVEKIGDNAFAESTSLHSVTMGNGVKDIGDSAFKNCSSLKEVVIPSSVEKIGDHAFTGSTSLNSVRIENGVKEIGVGAFSGCGFKTFIVPDSVYSIGETAFWGCTALENITIDNGLQKLGNDVFKNCNSLQYNEYGNVCYLGNESNPYLILARIENKETISIDIVQGTKFICNDVFKELDNLSAISVAEKNEVFASQDGILYNKEKTELLHIPRQITGRIMIPNTLLELKTYAFSQLNEVTEILFEDNSAVAEFGEYMFYQCPKLEKVVLPNGLEKIGYYSFMGCEKLKSVNIPKGVTEIGIGLFKNCVELESIEIPNTVDTIRGEMFMNCSKLANVVFEEGSKIRYIEQRMFYGCASLTSIHIPDNVILIWEDAFQGCTSLTNINVSEDNENLSSVDGVLYSKDKTELIFYPTAKQGEFIIPNYVMNIQNKAFSYCEKLTSVKVQENSLLERIGGYAFQKCENLTSIEIPDTVVVMGVCVFAWCSQLKDIYYDGTKEQWEAIPDKSSWDDYLDSYTLHCSDGDIVK